MILQNKIEAKFDGDISMKFKELIDEFVQMQENDKKERTSVTYKRKIYVFYEFVTIKLQARDVNFSSILSAMTLEQLLQSVEYYVATCEIKYIATVDTYISVLGLFFTYISDKYGWRNQYFEVSSKNKELKIAYDDTIMKLELNTKKQVNPLTEEEAQKLLIACNDKIDNVNIHDVVSGKNNGAFSGYISSLTTKLVLLCGTKNGVINEMKIDDYDKNLNKITINGFTIRIPDKFSIQMKGYFEIRKQIIKNETTSRRLFIDVANIEKKLDNSKMFFILKDVLGSNQATAVAKYSIIQMIKQGIPAHIIRDFTGYQKDVYNHCQEIVDEENGILMISEKSKLLDSALRKNVLYDEM